MKEHEIDDRDLTRSRPTDQASLEGPDPVLCPECQGAGAIPTGETCPVCEGTGKATEEPAAAEALAGRIQRRSSLSLDGDTLADFAICGIFLLLQGTNRG